MAIPVPVNGYYVFDLQGVSGEKVAINFNKGAAIKTDGPGKYIIYSGGQALSVVLPDALPALLAGL